MTIKSQLHQLIFDIPYFGKRLKLLKDCGFEPGHYYSTIPDLEDIQKRRASIFNKSEESIKSINLNKQFQFELLEEFKKYYKDIPYDFTEKSVSNTRYQVKDAWYRYSDAIMLFSMIRHFKPANIIEIGSGYSSAIMLDTNDLFFNSKINLTFIDPHTERLQSLLTASDKTNQQVIQKAVQDVDLEKFTQLKANDILFVDSSHVSKIGSDLNHILFEILPMLNKGVLVHFHDVHFPFELPEHWVFRNKWFWNENYLMRAFLSGNSEYEIVNFNTYLHKLFPDWFAQNMPACLIGVNDVGSIWIRKK